ncbi:MAG: Trimethylguanosine synthase [Trizodia sp. TS-e1964]|nr:MAG: Trimethylguanosine synthase [Trizodia sp. TS-e1964]
MDNICNHGTHKRVDAFSTEGYSSEDTGPSSTQRESRTRALRRAAAKRQGHVDHQIRNQLRQQGRSLLGSQSAAGDHPMIDADGADGNAGSGSDYAMDGDVEDADESDSYASAQESEHCEGGTRRSVHEDPSIAVPKLGVHDRRTPLSAQLIAPNAPGHSVNSARLTGDADSDKGNIKMLDHSSRETMESMCHDDSPFHDWLEKEENYLLWIAAFRPTVAADIAPKFLKYWQQRYELFSRYDQGIWMSPEAWFSVTPEPVAKLIAKELAERSESNKSIIVDCFSGVGGNAIAFALSGRWKKVIAIERDVDVLHCAMNNARIYGANNIFWICGDVFEYMPKIFTQKEISQDVVFFASPPWGGPEYMKKPVFDLQSMYPYSLFDILTALPVGTTGVALYLPRNSDYRQLVEKGNRCDITHYCMHRASKAIVVYYGDLCYLNKKSGLLRSGRQLVFEDRIIEEY